MLRGLGTAGDATPQPPPPRGGREQEKQWLALPKSSHAAPESEGLTRDQNPVLACLDQDQGDLSRSSARTAAPSATLSEDGIKHPGPDKASDLLAANQRLDSFSRALILGGVRSGKSRLAERLASEGAGPVTYIATATAGDGEMAARIRVHRAQRPAHWGLVEEPLHLAAALAAHAARGTACWSIA